MKTCQIRNRTRQTLLLEEAWIADRFLTRLRGLLGREGLKPGQGLVIRPCNNIHTFHMKFAIDVAFCARDGRVCQVLTNLPRGRVSPTVRQAHYVIEAAAGSFGPDRLRIGDIVQLEVR